MPFLYDQIGGGLWHTIANGQWKRVALGYSGTGDGLNNPSFQYVKNIGPIPVGAYTITQSTVKGKGPLVFDLTPLAKAQLKGRDNFLIHWNTPDHGLHASEGCIIFNDPFPFQQIQAAVSAGDRSLVVVSMPPLPTPLPLPLPSVVT